MPRAKSSRPRPPRYMLEPGALIYESLRQAARVLPVSAEARDTYRVILGLSWMNKYQFTPPITRRQIADERGIADEGTITRHINELAEAGYLTAQSSDGSASTYIPHITYQTDTTTAHSPAVFPADPQHDTAHSMTQHDTTHSGTQHPTEPHARAPGVSGEPHARAPGVPINSSSSCVLTLNQDLNSQQLQLLNILLDVGVFPDSAREMLTGTPYDDILAWLHALIGDDGVRNVASVLVANVLRDRRPPPRGPEPGSREARDRIKREVEWGIRPRETRAAPPHMSAEMPNPVITTQADDPSAGIWQRALSQLQLQLTRATFDTWLRRSRLVSAADGVYVVGVHNGYAKDWLENRLYSTIKRTLVSIINWPVEVRFVVLNEEQHESVISNP